MKAPPSGFIECSEPNPLQLTFEPRSKLCRDGGPAQIQPFLGRLLLVVHVVITHFGVAVALDDLNVLAAAGG